MKKEYSLKKKEEFNNLLKNGKRYYSRIFTIYYLPNDSFKIGISIPKKNGNAVYRNKYKRIIKNILNDQNLYCNKKYKLLIIVKKNVEETTFIQMEKEIRKSLEKIEE